MKFHLSWGLLITDKILNSISSVVNFYSSKHRNFVMDALLLYDYDF